MNTLATEGEGKENHHLLLDVRGNTATKDEEKVEVLNAFFCLSSKQCPVVF